MIEFTGETHSQRSKIYKGLGKVGTAIFLSEMSHKHSLCVLPLAIYNYRIESVAWFHRLPGRHGFNRKFGVLLTNCVAGRLALEIQRFSFDHVYKITTEILAAVKQLLKKGLLLPVLGLHLET